MAGKAKKPTTTRKARSVEIEMDEAVQTQSQLDAERAAYREQVREEREQTFAENIAYDVAGELCKYREGADAGRWAADFVLAFRKRLAEPTAPVPTPDPAGVPVMPAEIPTPKDRHQPAELNAADVS